MVDTVHHRLIVLGSGPAGYTAALYAARANLKPALITGIEVGGQLTTTTEVENWPGGHAELQGPELMMQMAEHVERFDAHLVNDHIHTADLSTKPIRLEGDQAHYTCDALIIATGATAKYLGSRAGSISGMSEGLWGRAILFWVCLCSSSFWDSSAKSLLNLMK